MKKNEKYGKLSDYKTQITGLSPTFSRKRGVVIQNKAVMSDVIYTFFSKRQPFYVDTIKELRPYFSTINPLFSYHSAFLFQKV